MTFAAGASPFGAGDEYAFIGIADLAPEAVKVAPGRIDLSQRARKALLFPLLVGPGEPVDLPFPDRGDDQGVERMVAGVVHALPVHLFQRFHAPGMAKGGGEAAGAREDPPDTAALLAFPFG